MGSKIKERRRIRGAVERAAAGIVALMVLLWVRGASAAETALQNNHGLAGTDTLSTGNLFQVTLGLLAVVATIFALAWFVRRYGRFQAAANGSLKVVGGLSVGPRERVVLVQVEDRQILLGVAPGRVQMLHALESRMPVQEVTGDDGQAPKRNLFASLLKSGHA